MNSVKEIKKDPNGVIRLDDFMTLFKIVTKHAKRKISIVKGKYAKERRAALKAGDDTTYR